MTVENSLKYLHFNSFDILPETVPVVTKSDKKRFNEHKSKTSDDYVSYQLFAIPHMCEWLQIILFSSEVQWLVMIRSDDFKPYFGLTDKPVCYFDSGFFVIALFYIGVIAGCMLVTALPIPNWRHKSLFAQALYPFTLVPMVFSDHNVYLFAGGRLLCGISAGLSLVSLSYFNQQLLVGIRYTTVKFLATYLFIPAATGWLALGHYFGTLGMLSGVVLIASVLTGLTYLLPNSVFSTLKSDQYITQETKELFQNSYCRFKGSKRYGLSPDEITEYIGHYHHYFQQERIQTKTLFKGWVNKLWLYLACGLTLLYIEMTTGVLWLMLYYPLVIVAWNPYHTTALYVAVAMYGLSLVGNCLWKNNHRVCYPYSTLYFPRTVLLVCSLALYLDNFLDGPMIFEACFSLPLLLLSSLTYPYATVLDNFPEHTRYQTVFTIKAVVLLLAAYLSAIFSYDSYSLIIWSLLDVEYTVSLIVFGLAPVLSYWLEKAYFGKYEILPRNFVVLDKPTIRRRGLVSNEE